MSDNRESILARWYRLKTAAINEHSAPQAQTARPDSDFEDVDFSKLDINSDFVRFMDQDVPDTIRNQALQMLWASSDLIGKPDDLDDFLEDFTEQAKALSPELARSAYNIGAGFAMEDTNFYEAGNEEGVTEPKKVLQHTVEPEPKNRNTEISQAHSACADDI